MNVGLLGCGRIARFFHLDILARRSPFRLVAVADADAEARSAAEARAPDADLYPDYESLLARDDLEAVVVCLPPALHVPAGLAAFDAGVHVYMEKPLARSPEEAEPLLSAWRRSGRVGMMGLNYRFDRAIREARRAVDAGRLGDVVAVRTVFTSESRELPGWKESREGGGGVLLDLATHHVDLACFLLGEEPSRASAVVRSDRVEADHAAVTLDFPSGAVMQSLFSMSSVHDHRIEIHGRDAILRIDRFRRPQLSFRRTPPTSRPARLRKSLAELLPDRWAGPFDEPTYEAALLAFARAAREFPVTDDGKPSSRPDESEALKDLPDLEDGMRAMVLIDRLEESARRGQPVSIPPPEERNAASAGDSPR